MKKTFYKSFTWEHCLSGGAHVDALEIKTAMLAGKSAFRVDFLKAWGFREGYENIGYRKDVVPSEEAAKEAVRAARDILAKAAEKGLFGEIANALMSYGYDDLTRLEKRVETA